MANKERPISVAIIGTAGRKEDAAKMSLALFEKMKQKAETIILQDWKLQRNQVVLVSGGAAWADHVAVRLFTESVCVTDNPFAALHLHLPCHLKEEGEKTRAVDTAPGQTMNSLHYQFSKAMGANTLCELAVAKSLGATINVSNGFYARNAHVAKSNRVIAFTWGPSAAIPKDGGTLHTWNLAKTSSHKLHVPLHTL